MSEQIKVGDSVDLGKPYGLVRLPDGTVVSAGGSYTVQHEGTHAIVIGDVEREFVGVTTVKPEPSKPAPSKRKN